MHGRQKKERTAEEETAKQKENTKKMSAYRYAMGIIFDKRGKNELDDELLKITGQVLSSNPDIHTLWNVRKEVLTVLKKTDYEKFVDQVVPKELDFTEFCLKSNPKSYGAWHHRCWIMKETNFCKLASELKLIAKYLEYDDRNFHCWDYRRYLLDNCSAVTLEQEFDFTTEKISSNFSNFSSWHLRSKLLPKLARDYLSDELELIRNAVFTDPKDQSAWFYHRWLLKSQLPEPEYWLHPAWFGAADIKVGNEELDCSLEAIDYATGEVSNEAIKSWIQPKTTRLRFWNDVTNPAFRTFWKSGNDQKIILTCLVYPWEDDLNNQLGSGIYGFESTRPKFAGRCFNHTSNRPLSNYTQSCRSDPSGAFSGVDLNIFQNYSDYKDKLTQGRLRQCEQKCVEPDPKNLTHLEDIQAFPKTKDNRTINEKPQVTLQILREARAESRNTTFWQTRKFHGNLCVFVAMFLIPVSNFIARYYKETFLTHYHTVPAWLWSHGTTGYFVLTLIRCSYTAMRENINNWGQSLDSNGKWHRWLGYTFIVIYTLMSTLGAVRILKNPCKIVSVVAHAVTGSLLYVMAMYLVISSHNIPGSPSAKCSNDTKLPEGTSQTAIYAYIWIGLDICFHVLMTIWQIMLDKREQIRRPGGLRAFPFLPMMQPKDRRNFVGATARKIVLVVYATAAATMSFLIIAGMFVDDDYARCDLGNLTCNDRQHPFGCSPISKKYFKIITTERYNVTGLEDFVE